MSSNIASAIRWCAGSSCTPTSFAAPISRRPPIMRSASCSAARSTAVGAEVIVPLQARGRVSGWLFFGHRLTGQPFDYQSLEALMILGDHVSTVLENALLNEEVTLQKTLAETLLAAIPPGIIASDEDAIIRWCNPSAESILGLGGSGRAEQAHRMRRQPHRLPFA